MNHQNLFAKKISIGKNTHIEPTAIIRGLNGLAEEIYIGDNVYIGHYVEIICDWFAVGDYGKIHHHTNIHGYQHPATLGITCGAGSTLLSTQLAALPLVITAALGHTRNYGAT